MLIEFRRARASLFLLTIVSLLGTAGFLWATTVEIENEDDDVSAVSTPVEEPPSPQAASPSDKTIEPDLGLESVNNNKGKQQPSSPTPASNLVPSKKESVLETPTPKVVPVEYETKNSERTTSPALARPRVRISDKVGFYYFVSAGYLVPDPSQIPSLGKVIGNPENDQNFTTPKRIYVEQASYGNKVKPDDLLVVFRTVLPIHEPHSGDMGYQVENLAIVKVVEIQKRRILVEVKESFRPCQEGDRVEPYENEIKRWKQSQVKKALPSHPIKCFVVGGEVSRQNYEQTDFIFLSAGSKMGVVEGQNFDLREITDTGAMEESFHTLEGMAQVIFSGPNASTAEIIRNHEPIQKSFEAVYQP